MKYLHKPIALLASAASILALGSVGVAAAAPAGPVTDTGVAIQANPNPKSYDIGWVEQSTGSYFLSDTSHGQVVMYDVSGGPKADHFVRVYGQGAFTGAPATCSVPHACNGPDGVVTDSNGNIWAGDGDSSVKEINRTTGKVTSISTGGKLRADELAYDPTSQMILVANDADGFLTFIDTKKGSVAGHYYYSDTTAAPTAPEAKQSLATGGNGIEQPVWDPATGLFYQAIPANTIAPGKPGTSTTGRIDVFKPTPDANGNGQLVSSFNITGCDNGPTGLVLTANKTLVGACDNGGAVVNVSDGKVLGMIPNVGGADELWFNSTDGNVYFARSGAGMLGVGNPTTMQFVANFPTGKGSHSVAADAANNQVLVPLNGKGIEVFAPAAAAVTAASPAPAPAQAPAGPVPAPVQAPM